MNGVTSAPGPRPERFPAGRFNIGDFVRLKRPGAARGSFKNPRALLQIQAVNYFRMYQLPTYVLAEPGGIGVTPFRDDDLRRGRRPGAGASLSAVNLGQP